VLRNQTASVVRRHGNDQKRHPKSSPRIAAPISLQSRSLPKEVAPPFDCLVLPFLFGSHDPMQDQRASHGHFDFLPTLYQQAASESPLSKTISWLAFVLMGILFDNNVNWWHEHRNEENRLMAGVIRNIQRAIADPISSVQIDTLTAVVLLGYGEHLRSRTYEQSSRSPPSLALSLSLSPSTHKMTKKFMIHQAGAEALVRKRGALNFQDNASLALFAAVRHNAVSIAMSGIEKRSTNWDLWDTTDNQSRYLCDSYTPATELDACGARMVILQRRLASENIHGDFSADMLLRNDLLELLERLHTWSYRIPADWIISNEQEQGVSERLFLSPEVCYLFNQWYLLQLGVSHLLKQLSIKTTMERYTENDYLCENGWIDSIIASSYLYLGHRPSAMENPLLTFSNQTAAPVGIVRQFCVARRGSRLFGQTLEKLDIALSDALDSLGLPQAVDSRYREVLEWARKERNGRS
jgi:hypothetical protein